MCVNITTTMNGLVKYPDSAPVAIWPVANPGWVAMGEGIAFLMRLNAQRRSEIAVGMSVWVQKSGAIQLWRWP